MTTIAPPPDGSKTREGRKLLLAAALLITAPLICLPLFPKYGAPLAVFFSIVPLWFAELLPLPVTALLVPVLSALYGAVPANKAFEGFGSDILFLFIGCFWLTKAMQKHNWDKRMAYFVLSRGFTGDSASRLVHLIGTCAFVLGMWVSNTATTAIMTAISLGVINSLKDRFSSSGVRRRFVLRLLLTSAYAASIAGLATPVGTPPNLIVLEFLRRQGGQISFLQWMVHGLPLSLVIMGAMLIVLERLFPLRGEKLAGLQQHFRSELKALGPTTVAEIQVAAVFTLMVLLWITPGLASYAFPDSPLAAATSRVLTLPLVGISGGLLLFFLPSRDTSGAVRSNLSWEDAKDIDWGTILLFGGGLCLGRVLEASGLALFLGTSLFGGLASPAAIALVLVLVCVMMSEFSSSTAAAAVLVPVLVPAMLSVHGPDAAPILSMGIAFAVSLGFMLPVSTPPNAIVYGTGMIPLRSLVRAGVALDIIGIAVVFGWIYLRL